MLIVRGNEKPPRKVQAGVVAIGNFDGVHRGHQVLIDKARERADKLGCLAGVIVFEPQPREFFTPGKPHFRLTPLQEKLRLFQIYGLDFTIVLDFCQSLASQTADQFISSILIERLAVRHVVVGYDFSFGKGRTGTVDTLSQAGLKHGFGVTVVPAQSPIKSMKPEAGDKGRQTVSVQNPNQNISGKTEVFSSSSIRKNLNNGDVQSAAKSLGHWWRITGTVIAGAKVGTDIGYPTANIALDPGTALAHGIYAVRVWIDQNQYDGAAYFGTRPTLDNGPPILEVTIFQFDGDLYGREMSVDFIDFVRPDKQFSSMKELKQQIQKDCHQVRDLLAAAGDKPNFDA